MQDTIIETPRLHIHPLRSAFVDEIHAAKMDAWHDLQMWMSWATDDMKPRAAMDSYIASLSPDNPWDAATAFCREDGRFAVMSGLHSDSIAAGADYSTGYWCARDKRGKGYATETTNALIRYAFEVLNAGQIRISYYQDNMPSRRVIDKLGFTYTHTVAGGHKRCLDGTPLDVHHFVMTDPALLPPLDWRVMQAA